MCFEEDTLTRTLYLLISSLVYQVVLTKSNSLRQKYHQLEKITHLLSNLPSPSTHHVQNSYHDVLHFLLRMCLSPVLSVPAVVKSEGSRLLHRLAIVAHKLVNMSKA